MCAALDGMYAVVARVSVIYFYMTGNTRHSVGTLGDIGVERLRPGRQDQPRLACGGCPVPYSSRRRSERGCASDATTTGPVYVVVVAHTLAAAQPRCNSSKEA